MAVSTARVTAFAAGGKAAVEVFADRIGSVELQSRFTGRNCLVISTRDGVEINFGDIPAADAPMVLAAVQRLAAAGVPPALERAATGQEAAWNQVRNVGNRPTAKAWSVIREHASPGEVPWFVVGAEVAGGALAAFADRCLIVKVGAMTSMMAGSFGGGRITTFPFAEITGSSATPACSTAFSRSSRPATRERRTRIIGAAPSSP